MATCIWKGGTGSVAGTQVVQQTATLLISSNTNTHTFTVSATNPSGSDIASVVLILTVTANGVFTTTELADQIVAAWNASPHEYALAVTASNVANTITFTSDYPGIPFIISKGGTGTSTLSAAIANQGPNDYSVPSNWIAGAVPVANDTVIISNHPNGQKFDIVYGLAQSAVALDEFRVYNYNGAIGSHSTPLHFDVDDRFTFNSQNAIGYFKLVASGSIAVVSIEATGNKGNFGCYFDGGTGSQLAVVRLTGGAAHFSYLNREIEPQAVQNIGGKCRFDLPPITFNQSDGESQIFWPLASGTTTLIAVDDGVCWLETHHIITTLTINGGQVWFRGTGTLTLVNAFAGLFDALGAKETTTITTLSWKPGAVVRFDTTYIQPGTFTRPGPMEYRSAPTETDYGGRN